MKKSKEKIFVSNKGCLDVHINIVEVCYNE